MSAVLSLNDILVRPDVWRGRLAEAAVPAQSSGFPVLDAELPGGGWPRAAPFCSGSSTMGDALPPWASAR